MLLMSHNTIKQDIDNFKDEPVGYLSAIFKKDFGGCSEKDLEELLLAIRVGKSNYIADPHFNRRCDMLIDRVESKLRQDRDHVLDQQYKTILRWTKAGVVIAILTAISTLTVYFFPHK